MANNAYNKALAQINQGRLNTLTNYGYTGTVDPKTGVVGGVRVDPHSIYGQLQQMLHTQASEDQNALYAAEDRGLHGGLANQAQTELRYQHGAQDTTLGNQLQGTLSDYQNQQQQAAEARDNALWQAQQAELEAELQAEYNASLQAFLAGFLGSNSNPNSTPVATGGADKTGYYFNMKTGQSYKNRPSTGKTMYAT